MATKGGSYSRPSPSATAYGGSGGLGGNTSLTKFSRKRPESLEGIVNQTYKEINKNLEARSKTAASRALLSVMAPGLYDGLQLFEFLYKHGKVIVRTIENVVNIWSDDSTPVTDKVITTTGEVLEGGYEIAKDELKERGVAIIASAFAEQATNTIEDTGVIDDVSKAVGLENHADRFKDLLQDTIEKQTTTVLNQVIGE